MIASSIKKVVDGSNLTAAEVEASMNEILAGTATPAQIAAFVEPGVVANLLDCEEGWCRITVDSHRITGWMPQDVLWGILPNEFLN